MASILLLSEKGQILPIGGRLKNEGHLVKVWIKDGNQEILKGSRNPSRIQKALQMLEQYDLILCESKLSEMAFEIQQAGKAVLGSNSVVGKLMSDLEYQQKVINFILGKQGPLEGITVRLAGWMGPEGFSPLSLLSLPCTYFMDKDKGYNTEGMGSLVVFLNEGSKLTEVLYPFQDFLLKAKYQGPFNVNLRVKGPLHECYSINSCFIPEDLLAGAELLKQPLFEFLLDLLDKGQKGQAWNGLGLSVKLSAPPWPYIGVPVKAGYLEIPEQAKKHLSLGAPETGILGVATARGEDLREARRRVYRTIQNSVQDKRVQYREDIGLEGENDIKALKEWGWLA